ncbi:MAG: ERAP1-like C-terminal domain-containing protein, partial [Vulcanimicrobiaceae bacterium]
PHVVTAILGEYESMLKFEKGKPGEAAAKNFIIAQVKPMLPKLGGWDGVGMTDSQLKVRNTILGLLARSDDADTIAQAKARFAKLIADPKAYRPLDKFAIIGIAGYAADADIYRKLMGMAMRSTNPQEQQNDWFALFGAHDPALAKQNLNLTLHLPPQFASYAPFIVAAVGTQHPALAWKFLNDNYAKLFASTTEFESAMMSTGVAQQFATLIPADQIAAYFKAHIPADGAPQVKQAMDNINTQQAVEDRLLPQIDAYVASQSATDTPKR